MTVVLCFGITTSTVVVISKLIQEHITMALIPPPNQAGIPLPPNPPNPPLFNDIAQAQQYVDGLIQTRSSKRLSVQPYQ